MKSKFFFILVFLASGISLIRAQERLANPELYFGAMGGATFSQVGFSPTIQQNGLLGTNFGVMARYVSNKYVGIQGEINFAQMGWSESTTNYTRQLNYIEVPFLTHIYLGSKTKFIANLGPQISFMLGDKANNVPAGSTDEQYDAVYNKFDYGFTLGLGMVVPFGINSFQLEVRGYYGMGDVFSNDKRDYFARSNNLKASLNFSWLFRVK